MNGDIFKCRLLARRGVFLQNPKIPLTGNLKTGLAQTAQKISHKPQTKQAFNLIRKGKKKTA
jgi:hypothetical protein